jgi:hypothetical protein
MKTIMSVLSIGLFAIVLSSTVSPLQAGISRGGDRNTNQGVDALHNNTAVGFQALYNNIAGGSDSATMQAGSIAVGYQALFSNTTGQAVAVGFQALYNNTTGVRNAAFGSGTLQANTTGESNTGTGQISLFQNTSGGWNTASGRRALFRNTTGNLNIGLGYSGGYFLTTGDNNIDIGSVGVAGESNTIRIGQSVPVVPNAPDGVLLQPHTATFIAGIFGATTAGGSPVFVDANGKLGTFPSSQRFKDGIRPMAKASEAILSLRPVTFRYKKEIDAKSTPQFGLVAEEVAKVTPDLVALDGKGEIYSVRYEAVNAMLLNEFIKEHQQVQEQQKQIDKLIAQAKEQAALIQKVSARVELSRSAPKTAANNE